MGYKYTVCFMLGTLAIESIGTESLVSALWHLFAYKCTHDFAWKKLEIRN